MTYSLIRRIVVPAVALTASACAHQAAASGAFRTLGVEFPQPYHGYSMIPGYTFSVAAADNDVPAIVRGIAATQDAEVSAEWPGVVLLSLKTPSRCAFGTREIDCGVAIFVMHKTANAGTAVSIGALEFVPDVNGVDYSSTRSSNGRVTARVVQPGGRNWTSIERFAGPLARVN